VHSLAVLQDCNTGCWFPNIVCDFLSDSMFVFSVTKYTNYGTVTDMMIVILIITFVIIMSFSHFSTYGWNCRIFFVKSEYF